MNLSPEPPQPAAPNFPLIKQHVLALTTLLASSLILYEWEAALSHSQNSEPKQIQNHIKWLDKIRFSLTNSSKSFEKTWRPIIEYLSKATIHDKQVMRN